MCMQAISHEVRGTNTKVHNRDIIIIRILAQTKTFPSPPTVMVAVLANNLIVTFLIHPAKYMPKSLMKNQTMQIMLVLEWPQENTPTTSPLIPVMIL